MREDIDYITPVIEYPINAETPATMGEICCLSTIIGQEHDCYNTKPSEHSALSECFRGLPARYSAVQDRIR